MALCTRLSDLMESNELTAYKLSKATGISEANISNWRLGKAAPSIENLEKLADHFGVTTDYLLGRSNQGQVERQDGDDLLWAAIHGHAELSDDEKREMLEFVRKRKSLRGK